MKKNEGEEAKKVL